MTSAANAILEIRPAIWHMQQAHCASILYTLLCAKNA